MPINARLKLTISFFVVAFSICLIPRAVFAQNDRRLERDPKPSAGDRRIALVIGNGAYTAAKPLPNPANDAEDMAKSLGALGFEVISGVNLTKREMETLIRDFGTRLAANGGTGLFYFAGHGVQVGGENYLVPVEADIPEADEVAYAAVPVSLVLAKMSTAKNDLNIVILDACRNNPFARSWRSFRDGSSDGGLAKISPPTGTLVLYATEPGKVASDGTGRNGLFTEALLNQINRPNLEYDQLVKAVSADVWARSNKQQLPWKEGNSLQDFYFRKGPADIGPTPPDLGRAPAGAVHRNSSGIDLVLLPPGEFLMGSDSDKVEMPVHKVTFREGFWIGKYEITQSQWESVMGTTLRRQRDGVDPNRELFGEGPNHPIYFVSWNDARDFVRRLNEKNDGFEYGLPTESQWEYAARAGGTAAGPVLEEFAWFANNSGRTVVDADAIARADSANYLRKLTANGAQTRPVGAKRPNAFGLFDTSGNVWEWCEDIHSPDYVGAPADGSAAMRKDAPNLRSLRGGSWFNFGWVLRPTLRVWREPDFRDHDIGFRIVARVKK